MMDLSILEKVFALREEVLGDQLAEDSPDFSRPGRVPAGGSSGRAPVSPQDKLASDLMARAVSLHGMAQKLGDKEDRTSRETVINLLKAASAPIEPFGESDLAWDSSAPMRTSERVDPIEESVPQAPRRTARTKRDGPRKTTAQKKKAQRVKKKKG